MVQGVECWVALCQFSSDAWLSNLKVLFVSGFSHLQNIMKQASPEQD